MAKRIGIIAVLMMVGLCGCGKEQDTTGVATTQQPVTEVATTEEATTEQGSTEILNPPNGDVFYTNEELRIVENALGDSVGAPRIMKQLNQFGIYNIIRADLLVETGDKELEVETSDNRIFVVHFYNGDHHIYAIEKDGEYIYTEVK